MREDEPQRGQGHLRQEEEEEAEGVELEEAHVLPKGADAAREADLERGDFCLEKCKKSGQLSISNIFAIKIKYSPPKKNEGFFCI